MARAFYASIRVQRKGSSAWDLVPRACSHSAKEPSDRSPGSSVGLKKKKKKATTLVLTLGGNFYQLFWTQFSDERRGRVRVSGDPTVIKPSDSIFPAPTSSPPPREAEAFAPVPQAHPREGLRHPSLLKSDPPTSQPPQRRGSQAPAHRQLALFRCAIQKHAGSDAIRRIM